MRSSASTPTLPADPGPIPLWIDVTGEDHPKACTGRKLLRRGLASRRGGGRTRPRAGPIRLDPHAATPLSPADASRALAGGILAVDCSWNRLGERRGELPRSPGGRRLPYLLATNPQHYGRLSELNTAEALAAALWLLGERARAESLLAGFPGGPAFFEVNRRLLERYAACPDGESIVAAERELL